MNQAQPGDPPGAARVRMRQESLMGDHRYIYVFDEELRPMRAGKAGSIELRLELVPDDPRGRDQVEAWEQFTDSNRAQAVIIVERLTEVGRSGQRRERRQGILPAFPGNVLAQPPKFDVPAVSGIK